MLWMVPSPKFHVYVVMGSLVIGEKLALASNFSTIVAEMAWPVRLGATV